MKKTGGSVAAFLAGVTPEKRRRDAETMVALMRDITGREPELWGTIVGFGSCHYRYPTGTEGDVPIAAFAPRKQATTVYLLDAGAHDLGALGPHTTGAGCLYLKDLEDVDIDVLRHAIATDYRRVLDGDTGYAVYTVTD
jgi:hypothetical protein